MNRILLSAAAIAFCAVSSAQNVIGIPELGTGYPRMIDGEECRQEITSLLETVPGATAMKELESKIRPYAERHVTDPEWIVSRLQMYWDTHATDVYVKGEVYSHAEGHAPVPTVRFAGAREASSNYRRPALADIRPEDFGLESIRKGIGIFLQSI